MILKRSLLACTLSCITLTVSAHSDFGVHSVDTQFHVPEIGGGVGLIDQQKERQIGEKVFREIQKQMPVIHDPWLQEQYSQIFLRILTQTSITQPVGLVIIKDPQINAFAVPGGLFALNTGLIANARNTDEVAGVMAHEIAHVTQRHYSRSQEAFKGQGLLALAGIIVGAAVATTSNADVGSAVMLGTQAALMDQQLTYSRNQEREADRIGMQYMYAAGYNPQSMADFFETMQRSRVGSSFMPDFWMTHPLTTERMSEARLRANQLPKIETKLYDPNFQLLKWYTLAISDQSAETRLENLVKQGNTEAQLALAAYYVKQGDSVKAQMQLDDIKSQFNENTLYSLIQTDIYLGQNKLELAYSSIINIQRAIPESRALAYKLAEVMILQGKAGNTLQLVQPFVNRNPRDLEGWQLMQQASSIDRLSPVQAVNTLRYRAEVQFWSGNEKNAIKSLLHAQRLAKGNESLAARIDSRLKQMQSDYTMKI